MKFYCDRKRMLEAVSNAVLITKKNKHESPVVSNVMIDIMEGDCRILSTNFEETLRESIPIDGTDCSLPRILVPADKLKKVLSKGKTDMVKIETNEQCWFNITMGKVKTKLPGVDYQSFPEIPVKTLPKRFTLAGKDLKDIFDKTYFSIGENESRKNLTGLNIKQVDQSIMFEGADAFRITRYFLPLAEDFEENAILPKQSFKTINTLFKNADCDIHFDRTHLIACNDEISFQCSLIDAEYPVLDKLFTYSSKECQVVPSDLIDGLDMMQVLTNNDTVAICKTSIKPDGINIESQKTEMSDGAVEIDCRYDSEPKTVGLNVKFFADVAKVFKKYDSMNIYCDGPELPVVFDCNDCPGFISVLMPVRVQW